MKKKTAFWYSIVGLICLISFAVSLKVAIDEDSDFALTTTIASVVAIILLIIWGEKKIRKDTPS